MHALQPAGVLALLLVVDQVAQVLPKVAVNAAHCQVGAELGDEILVQLSKDLCMGWDEMGSASLHAQVYGEVKAH